MKKLKPYIVIIFLLFVIISCNFNSDNDSDTSQTVISYKITFFHDASSYYDSNMRIIVNNDSLGFISYNSSASTVIKSGETCTYEAAIYDDSLGRYVKKVDSFTVHRESNISIAYLE